MATRPELLATANFLRHLLNTDAGYRRLWLARARRSAGSPNIDAVSRVLAEYHWSHEHLFDWEPPSDHRGYKDRVARALAAEAISPQTIHLITSAFGMTEDQHDRLLAMLTRSDGSVPLSWAQGEFPAPARPRRYQTVSLHELHVIGPHRIPTSHRTIHTIQALEDGVDEHVFSFDTPDVKVHAISGADAGPITPMDGGDGFWCCRLSFERPLARGQIRFFEYSTAFTYDQPPPPEMRKGSMYPLQMLSIRVEFSPQQLPLEVHWTSWDKLNAEADRIRPVDLDEDHAVCEVVNEVQAGQILGFTWTWGS